MLGLVIFSFRATDLTAHLKHRSQDLIWQTLSKSIPVGIVRIRTGSCRKGYPPPRDGFFQPGLHALRILQGKQFARVFFMVGCCHRVPRRKSGAELFDFLDIAVECLLPFRQHAIARGDVNGELLRRQHHI